jgi:hypothetical protein
VDHFHARQGFLCLRDGVRLLEKAVRHPYCKHGHGHVPDVPCVVVYLLWRRAGRGFVRQHENGPLSTRQQKKNGRSTSTCCHWPGIMDSHPGGVKSGGHRPRGRWNALSTSTTTTSGLKKNSSRSSLDELNEAALEWISEISVRTIGGLNETRNERFAHEKSFLTPLPKHSFDCRLPCRPGYQLRHW